MQPQPHTLDSLYDEHAQTVARWAARLGGPSIEVEDVVQEVFLVVHRKLDGFRGDARLTTWLYGITAKVVSHHRRRHRWRRWLLASPEASVETAWSGPTPSEQAERNRASAALYRALDRLPEVHRTAFVLFEIEGLDTKQICELLSITPNALWVRLHRARARLAKLIAAHDPGASPTIVPSPTLHDRRSA